MREETGDICGDLHQLIARFDRKGRTMTRVQMHTLTSNLRLRMYLPTFM
jgi:hypothetical protein